MSAIHDEILEALRNADSFLCLSDVFGFPVYQLGHELVDSFEEDGFIPYVVGERKRYRSSSLSTCLLYLWKSGLLPSGASEIIRNSLFKIRDTMPSHEKRTPRAKQHEDADAWCVAEGASVWSTSMALIALLESRCEQNAIQDEMLLGGAYWLVKQQNKKNGGWPFQNTDNSEPTVPMSALALRALSKATILPNIKNHIRDEIHASLTSGFNFLRSNLVSKSKIAYWEFDGQPSLTATVWALQAFNCDPRNVNHNININHILKFAISMFPDKEEEWVSERFVKEPVTKYSHQKNFYTFMPALIPPLINFGLSPIHPKIVCAIRQLMNAGQEHWRIKEYHLKPCTFTHAMAIYTLVQWCVHLQKVLCSGFLPLMEKSTSSQICPILTTNPKHCSAQQHLRKSILLNFLMLAVVIFLTVYIPQINGILHVIGDYLKKILANPWIMTLLGGGVASYIATIIYTHLKDKK